MKRRVKIDSAILSFAIILTGLLYQFPQLYTNGIFLDDVLDFIGLISVLKGTFLRMAARGYKKVHSKKGHELVMSGPYLFTRNPMYFGSFLMGAGFVLIVWPWWSLPIFGVLFYVRFNKQMVKEEEHLTEFFGEEFRTYCRKVPRFFPRPDAVRKIKFKDVFLPDVVWSTKEKRGLFAWPILAVVLETFQENVVFGFSDIRHTAAVFLSVALAFTIAVWIAYSKA